jgi:hypothetical protein
MKTAFHRLPALLARDRATVLPPLSSMADPPWHFSLVLGWGLAHSRPQEGRE